MPKKRLWEAAANAELKKNQYQALLRVIDAIKEAGALVTDDADIPSSEEIIAPDKWDW